MVTEILLVLSLGVNVLLGLEFDRKTRMVEQGWRREDGLRRLLLEALYGKAA